MTTRTTRESRFDTELPQDNLCGVPSWGHGYAWARMTTRAAQEDIWHRRLVAAQFGNWSEGAELVGQERTMSECALHCTCDALRDVHRRMRNTSDDPVLQVRDVVRRNQVNQVVSIRLTCLIPVARGNP